MLGLNQLSLGLQARGAVSASGFTQLASSAATSPYERRTADRAWSWHINDTVLHDPASARTYVTGQLMLDGSQVIDIYNTAGERQSTVVVNDNVATDFIPDDHNAPAMAIFNGRLYCGYAGHNDDNNVYIKRSSDTKPENLSSTPEVINNVSGTSYAQFAEYGGNLYVASRSGTRSWRMYVLDEATGTWSSEGQISVSASQTYINLRAANSALRYVAWDHVTRAEEPQRGEIKVREFQPTDAVEDLSALTTVYDPGSGMGSRVLDYASNGAAILFTEFTLGSTTGQTYHVLRYDGTGPYESASSWTKEDVGTNDYSFFPSSNYSPGGCFADETGTRLWLCEATPTGVTTIKYATRVGSTWTSETLGSSTRPLVRPAADVTAQGQVWMQRLNRYDDFIDFEADAFVLYAGDRNLTNADFEEPIPPVVGLREPPQILEYFDVPDLQTVSWSVDLTAAQDGDLLIAAYIYRDDGTSDLDLDGNVFTEHERVVGSSARVYVSSLVYADTMGDTLTLAGVANAGYQKLMLAIVTPEYAVQAFGESPAYVDDDLVLGVAFSRGNSNAVHTWSPDTSVSDVLHGSNTRISFGAASVTGTGTVNVNGFGSATEDLQVHLVLRAP